MTDYAQSIRSDIDGPVRLYEYDDSAVLVADFGPVSGDVDVVDGTAIIVINDEQYEFELPAASDSAVMNNGVVSIEMER